MLDNLIWAGFLAVLAIIGLLATGMSFFPDFQWEAISTLIAGLSAVVGAIYIGKRQLEISSGQNLILTRQADIASRQTDILSKQVDLENLKLRNDIFEKRFRVFSAAHDYLFHAYNGEDMTGHPAAIAFKEARDQAQFLFDQQVIDALEEFHNHGWQYWGLQRFVNTRAEQGNGDPEKDLAAVMEAQSQIGRDMSALPGVFKRHLTINDVAPSISTE